MIKLREMQLCPDSHCLDNQTGASSIDEAGKFGECRGGGSGSSSIWETCTVSSLVKATKLIYWFFHFFLGKSFILQQIAGCMEQKKAAPLLCNKVPRWEKLGWRRKWLIVRTPVFLPSLKCVWWLLGEHLLFHHRDKARTMIHEHSSSSPMRAAILTIYGAEK